MDKFNVSKLMDDLYKKNFGKNIFLFVMGMLISALSFNLFFERYDVIPTGSGGLALLIASFIKIDKSLMVFIVSLMCLLLGLIFFGYKYASKMLAVTFLYPFFISSTTLITRYIDLEDTSLFLIMLFGGGVMGLSSGLIRRSGFSPGGFCVIFDLMQKYFHISIGTSTIIVNTILIIASGFIFGFDKAVYTIVSLLVSSYIVDRVIIGISDNKVFYIVTNRPFEVKNCIVDKLNYSLTEVKVKGGHSDKGKKMFMCVIPTTSYIRLKELLKKIDPGAFFLIVDVYESSMKKEL